MVFGWNKPWSETTRDSKNIEEYMKAVQEWQELVRVSDQWVNPPQIGKLGDYRPPSYERPQYKFKFGDLSEQRLLDTFQASVERVFKNIAVTDMKYKLQGVRPVVNEIQISPGWGHEIVKVMGVIPYEYEMPGGTVSIGIGFEFTLGREYEVNHLVDQDISVVSSASMKMEMSLCIDKINKRISQLSQLSTWAETVKKEFKQPHLLKYSETSVPSTASTAASQKKGQELMVNGSTASGSGRGLQKEKKPCRLAKA